MAQADLGGRTMSARRVLLRLSSLPALAGAIVGLVAILTALEMRRPPTSASPSEPPQVLTLEREPFSSRAVVSQAPPSRTLVETAALLSAGPDLAMAEELWGERAYREELACLLEDSRVNSSVRIWLLIAFEQETPARAADAAREILRAGERDVTLRLSAYEVLGRQGSGQDLELLSPQAGEERQEMKVR